MKPDEYPAQEPLSDFARPYHEAVMQRAEGLGGVEVIHGDDPYQSLVYFPASDPSGPVLVMMHGGGWTNGYKEWMSFKSVPLNQAGIGFVSLGYRLAPRHVFPAGLEDCMAGLAWVYAHIEQMAGDPARIFVGGHSAGGHYASLMAVKHDWQQGYDLPADVIRGCVPVSGVYRFGPGSGLSIQPRFLGGGHNERAASPMFNIDARPPPFFISFGSEDFPHLKEQAVQMHDALTEHGGEVDILELADCDHLEASLVCGDPDGAWVRRVTHWIHHQ